MCEHTDSNEYTSGIDKDKKFSQMFKSNHRMLGVAGQPNAGAANGRRCR